MKKTNKKLWNKNKIKQLFQKILTANKPLSSNLVFKLAVALLTLTILAIIATAGNVIVKDGKLNVSGDLIADTNTLYVDSQNNRIGIGTIPSSTLTFNGDTTTWIVAERSSSKHGKHFFLRAGGAPQGSTNKNGGSLYLDGGISTGTGKSSVFIRTATGGTSGNTNRNPTIKVTVDGKGNVGIGDLSPTATLTVKTGGTTLADAWTVRSDRDIKTDISELDISDIIFNASVYKYKIKYEEPVLDEKTGKQISTKEEYTRERIGLMKDEVPQTCIIGEGVDLYCLIALQYAKIQELEKRIEQLEKGTKRLDEEKEQLGKETTEQPVKEEEQLEKGTTEQPDKGEEQPGEGTEQSETVE